MVIIAISIARTTATVKSRKSSLWVDRDMQPWFIVAADQYHVTVSQAQVKSS